MKLEKLPRWVIALATMVLTSITLALLVEVVFVGKHPLGTEWLGGWLLFVAGGSLGLVRTRQAPACCLVPRHVHWSNAQAARDGQARS